MADTSESVRYWLARFKRDDLAACHVAPAECVRFVEEVKRQHPEHTAREAAARGIARALCHMHPTPASAAVQPVSTAAAQSPAPVTPAPTTPASAPLRSHWRWVDAAILAAILMLLGARLAHCQAFGPLFIQSNGTKIATIAAVGTLNFTGSGTPCSASGVTITCDFASGSSGLSSVGLTMPSAFAVANSPLTSNGTIAVTFAAGQAQNEFLATPNGSSGAVSLRAIVPADIPTLNQNTTGNAATATALAATPSQCTSGQFATGIAASGNANCGTPSGGGSPITSWVDPAGMSSSGSTYNGGSANGIGCYEVFIPHSFTLGNFVFDVTTGDSGTVDLGLYNTSGTLLAHIGTQSAITTGVKDLPISGGGTITEPAAAYFLCMASTDGSMRVQGGSINLGPNGVVLISSTTSTGGVLPSAITVPTPSWQAASRTPSWAFH